MLAANLSSLGNSNFGSRSVRTVITHCWKRSRLLSKILVPKDCHSFFRSFTFQMPFFRTIGLSGCCKISRSLVIQSLYSSQANWLMIALSGAEFSFHEPTILAITNSEALGWLFQSLITIFVVSFTNSSGITSTGILLNAALIFSGIEEIAEAGVFALPLNMFIYLCP